MRAVIHALGAGIVGVGALGFLPAAQAEPPGVYYAWQSLASDVRQCISRASQALNSQNLALTQTDDNSIAGQSDQVTAVFVCLQNPSNTTVMIIVSSQDEVQAMAVREALKAAF
ncbi:MAG: hypothetical protein EA342_13360 [Leptolyngbya sp. LCM1.Bin17]|nr:MAG: hypothetical protein EA342_13360 [Leptolyngbya sp. LCM1.Bin17]